MVRVANSYLRFLVGLIQATRVYNSDEAANALDSQFEAWNYSDSNAISYENMAKFVSKSVMEKEFLPLLEETKAIPLANKMILRYLGLHSSGGRVELIDFVSRKDWTFRKVFIK